MPEIKKALKRVNKALERKSRATQIWLKCDTCSRRSYAADANETCGKDSCTGKLKLEQSQGSSKDIEIKAYKLSATIASVRVNVQSHPIRCFVDLDNKTCTALHCTGLNCRHVKAAIQQLHTPTKVIKVKEEQLFNVAEQDRKRIEKEASQIFYFGNERVVAFKDETKTIGFSHCSIDKKCYECTSKNNVNRGPQKEGPFCPHQLVLLTLKPNEPEPTKEPTKVIDPDSSSNINFKNLVNSLPFISDEDALNKATSESKPDDIQLFLDNQFTELHICEHCGSNDLVEYEYNRGNNCLFFTMDSVEKVTFKTKRCHECRTIMYPDLSKHTIINVHQRLLMTFNFFRLGQILIESGGNVIETLIGIIKMNAGSSTTSVSNPRNYAHDIYGIVISLTAACIRDEDINDNICPQCGIYPHICCSDGNIKNATNLNNTTIVFDKDPSNPNPSLTEYKNECATRIMRGNIKGSLTKKETYAFSIPTIMPTKLIKTRINTEEKKHKNSYLEKEFEFDHHKTSELFISNIISMDAVTEDKVSEKEMKEIAEKGGFNFKGKTPSKTALKQAFMSAYKVILSGDSECHTYVIKSGWTGGWVDCFCEHGFKIASKMLTKKESVGDHSDIRLSLHKIPKLHFIDDACTLARHEMIRSEESKRRLGADRFGCFENPHKTKPPNQDIDVPDIMPIHLYQEENDVEDKAYVAGHRLQFHSSHTKNSCHYHDINLTKQAHHHRTLIQEAMQMHRKFKRITKDRCHSLETTFLFNYIMDFWWNKKKFQSFNDTLKKNKQVANGRDDKWRLKIQDE